MIKFMLTYPASKVRLDVGSSDSLLGERKDTRNFEPAVINNYPLRKCCLLLYFHHNHAMVMMNDALQYFIIVYFVQLYRIINSKYAVDFFLENQFICRSNHNGYLCTIPPTVL